MLVQIELENEIAEKIKYLAEKDDRSFRKMVKIILKKYLKENYTEIEIETKPIPTFLANMSAPEIAYSKTYNSNEIAYFLENVDQTKYDEDKEHKDWINIGNNFSYNIKTKQMSHYQYGLINSKEEFDLYNIK